MPQASRHPHRPGPRVLRAAGRRAHLRAAARRWSGRSRSPTASSARGTGRRRSSAARCSQGRPSASWGPGTSAAGWARWARRGACAPSAAWTGRRPGVAACAGRRGVDARRLRRRWSPRPTSSACTCRSTEETHHIIDARVLSRDEGRIVPGEHGARRRRGRAGAATRSCTEGDRASGAALDVHETRGRGGASRRSRTCRTSSSPRTSVRWRWTPSGSSASGSWTARALTSGAASTSS